MDIKNATRALAIVSAMALGITAPPAIAQGRSAVRRTVNRVVEGTVSSVTREGNGERVRLTNGMDVLVPRTVARRSNTTRRGATVLQPGDIVRLDVYSNEGDGRIAQARSVEFLTRTGNNRYGNNGNYGNNNYGNNGNRMSGVVTTVDRRAGTLVMRADNGSLMTVRINGSAAGYRNGDRINVNGRYDRGTIYATDIRVDRNYR
jgi:hypothetical protein